MDNKHIKISSVILTNGERQIKTIVNISFTHKMAIIEKLNVEDVEILKSCVIHRMVIQNGPVLRVYSSVV